MTQPQQPIAPESVGLAILKAVRGELHELKKAYRDLSEVEQDRVLRRLEVAVRNAVQDGFHAIVADEFPAVRAMLDKVAITPKGIQGTLTMAGTSEHRHALFDHAGQPCVVVLATADKYLERMQEVRGDPQQPALDLEVPDTPADEDEDGGWEEGRPSPDSDPAPSIDPHPGPIGSVVLYTWFELAEVQGVDLTDLYAWNQETRAEVLDWLGALALKKNHPDFYTPRMPSVLSPGGEA